MDTVIGFFHHPFFIVMGGVSTIALIASGFYACYIVLSGIVPVWFRLGKSLFNRKIAVLGSGDHVDSVKNTLIDSGLIKEKNINVIDSNSIDALDVSSLIIFVWAADMLDEVLSKKRNGAALIVYAPSDKGKIDAASMAKITGRRNATVVNHRGRLMNDVIISMITTREKQ